MIYARYLSENQTEQSIEGQLRVCQQYAKNNSILIIDTYIDRAMIGTNDRAILYGYFVVEKKYRLHDIVVIKTTWDFLCDENTVRKIAEKVVKLHEAESKSNSNLKDLEAKRRTATKAADNLIRAIEQGIITEQTKTRLKELEAQISGLEFDIEREKQRSYTYLTTEMIEAFLRSLIENKTDSVEVRKELVKTFVREVIVYPDKFIITYNFTDHFDKHDITPDAVKEIEKQSERQQTAISYNQSSYKLASGASNKAEV